MNKYYVGISISELQHWLADDEFPVLTNRIIYCRKSLDDSLTASDLESLLQSLPAFSLNDLAGVLIVEVSGPDTWKADDNPGIRHLALSNVKTFIPLTEDAKIALNVQWSGVIKLSAAIFEHEFIYYRIFRKSISAERAGNLFANIFIDYGSKVFVANSLLTNSLPRALMAAEHRKLDDIEKLLDYQGDRLRETWLERVFGDIKKYDKDMVLASIKNYAVNLRSLLALGILFKTVEAQTAFTNKYRGVIRRLNDKAKDHDQSLTLVYADPEFSQFKINYFVDQQGSETISLITLGLFFRWKQAFLDQRSTVNPQLILDDVNSLAGSVDVEPVANALWMMGAYLGMEYIAPTYRHLHQENYHALRFAGNETGLTPVAVWQMKITKQSAEHEYASDLNINTETNEATQFEQQEKKNVAETKKTEIEPERATKGVEQLSISSPSEPSPVLHTSATSEGPQSIQTELSFPADSKVSAPSGRGAENVFPTKWAELEPEQVQLLTHLSNYSKINKKEAEKLLKVNSKLITPLLDKLAEMGLIERKGQKNQTHYVLAHNDQ
jgi:hypothetical protein